MDQQEKMLSVLKLITFQRIRRKLKLKPRLKYIRRIFQTRSTQGESVLAKELRDDPYYHFRYFRMNKENYDELLGMISTERQPKTHRHPISWQDKLALTLRYLASENSQISLGLSYRISPQSVSIIVRQVMALLCKHLGPKYLPSPTEDDWKLNEAGFRESWNFPNACGAMDGKHVRIRSPSFSGTNFYNYKNYYSISFLAIVGPTYKFTAVDIGYSGSQSDGGIFMRSQIGKRLENNEMGIPKAKKVGDVLLPHVILSDDAFSLKTYNMKPYPGKFLAESKRVFNYRLSRGRIVSENGFGILAARWRIFHTSIIGSLDLVKLIVKTCVLLHNFLLSKKDMNTITVDSEDQKGNWRETTASDNGLRDMASQGSNNYSSNASSVRDAFQNYFMTNGAVSWQNKRI